MLGAYGWAFVKPIRKLYYNLTITFVSVMVALPIGVIGYLIIAVFVLRWIASAANYHVRGYDRLEVRAG
jgi:high-affinity nickel-transport protein